MSHFQLRILCQSCSDKRKIQHAKNKANRIARGLKMLTGNHLASTHKSDSAHYFHTTARCRLSGGLCNRMSTYEQQLRIAEQELDRVFTILRIKLDSLDVKEAAQLRKKAYDLLRGYYPLAARLMQP